MIMQSYSKALKLNKTKLLISSKSSCSISESGSISDLDCLTETWYQPNMPRYLYFLGYISSLNKAYLVFVVF